MSRWSRCLLTVVLTCVVQAAAGERGAASQSGGAPVGPGRAPPACGRAGDLPEERRAQQRRGPEEEPGAPEGRPAVPDQPS